MKTKFIIAIVVIASAVLVLFFSFNITESAGNDETAAEVSVKEKEEEHSCCSSEEADEYTENSLYQLESDWVTQDGNKLALNELKGKPVVLTMFFASCTYACPILVNDMKKIESSLTEKEKQDYRFILVSIDPERDTPEALKKFADQKSLDPNRWTLLTGDKDDIMELAALTGFRYKKEQDGQYSHTNMIMILDEDGEIVHQHMGLNQDLTAALTVINNF